MNVSLCDEKMLLCLESIGIAKLADLKGKDPEDLIKRINEKAGHKLLGGPIPRMALQNLVRTADGVI